MDMSPTGSPSPWSLYFTQALVGMETLPHALSTHLPQATQCDEMPNITAAETIVYLGVSCGRQHIPK